MRILCVSASRLCNNIKNSNGVVAIAVFFLYIITVFFLSFSFVHIKVFLEKSLKVSLFVAKTDVYD